MLKNLREQRHNLLSQNFGSSKTLREKHDLCDEITVRLRHCKRTEQLKWVNEKNPRIIANLFQIIGQIGPTCITRVHRYEDAQMRINIYAFTN